MARECESYLQFVREIGGGDMGVIIDTLGFSLLPLSPDSLLKGPSLIITFSPLSLFLSLLLQKDI